MTKSLRIALWIIGILLITGTVLFHQIESWSWVDSFYFTGVSLLTIGYGDFVPTHDLSKILVVVLGFGAISTALFALFEVGRVVNQRFTRLHDQLEEHIGVVNHAPPESPSGKPKGKA